MTKKFDEAKAKTIQKCERVLEAVRLAEREEIGKCAFCWHYKGDCEKCPITKLCGGELHLEVESMLEEIGTKIKKGLSLLEEVKE